MSNAMKDTGSFFESYFTNLGDIGSGSFGTVIKVRHHIQDIDLQEYAIKRIAVGNSKPWLLKAIKEVAILQQLHHPNIVQYHYAWLESTKVAVNLDEKVPHLFILLDYAKGGSLTNLQPQTLGRSLTEVEFLSILRQAAAGLGHLHEVGFVSRDVKPSNFLLTGPADDEEPTEYVHQVFGANERTAEVLGLKKQFKTDQKLKNVCKQKLFIQKQGIVNLVVKLTDFGQMGDGVSAGTELLTAPEIFRGQKHSKASDVYSLGMTAMSLLSDELLEDHDQYQKFVTDKFRQSGFSQKTVGLLMSMVGEERPTCKEVSESCCKIVEEMEAERETKIERLQNIDVQTARPLVIPIIPKHAEARRDLAYLEVTTTISAVIMVLLLLLQFKK